MEGIPSTAAEQGQGDSRRRERKEREDQNTNGIAKWRRHWRRKGKAGIQRRTELKKFVTSTP